MISGRSLQLEGWCFQTSPRNGGTAIFDFLQSADERDGVVLCLMQEVSHCHAAGSISIKRAGYSIVSSRFLFFFVDFPDYLGSLPARGTSRFVPSIFLHLPSLPVSIAIRATRSSCSFALFLACTSHCTVTTSKARL